MDYKERFAIEYNQLMERIQDLKSVLEKWDNGTLEFDPLCPRRLLDLQLRAMIDYSIILEARAAIDKIVL